MLNAVSQRCLRRATSIARSMAQTQSRRNFAEEAPAPSASGKMSFTFASPSEV